jgi:hypothetical protein
MTRLKLALAGAVALTAAAAGTYAYAHHAWSTYHWSRSGPELTMRIGDNVSAAWDAHLSKAIVDWNQSSVIGATAAVGITNPKNCKPVSGRIEVCSSAYGNNGWLGIAQIWLSGGHITQGVTKLNDSYFKSGSRYNTPEWRAAVTCQEIGHDFGLGHQDEDFNTDATTSCMEYTSLPAGNGQPDAHDYEELEDIYAHAHSSFTTVTTTSPGRAPSEEAGGNSPGEWGRAVSYNAQGHPDVFVQELGGGSRKVTHVLWLPDLKRPVREADHD